MIFKLFLLFYLIDLPGMTHSLVRVRRIVSGVKVLPGEGPWVASIQAKSTTTLKSLFTEHYKSYCGGSLIADKWVLTAAHCFAIEDENHEGVFREILDPKLWHVRLGATNLTPTVKQRIGGFLNRAYNAVFKKQKKQSYYHVTKIIRHPKYKNDALEYDIALMRIKETLNFKELKTVATISLPEEGEHWPAIGQNCTTFGWGCSKAGGPVEPTVLKAHFNVHSPDVCRRMYVGNINLTTSHEFCAGFYQRNIGVCPGDSGGPLVCSLNGTPRIAGIVSATHSTRPGNYPGIFTRVSYFRSWIDKVLASDG